VTVSWLTRCYCRQLSLAVIDISLTPAREFASRSDRGKDKCTLKIWSNTVEYSCTRPKFLLGRKPMDDSVISQEGWYVSQEVQLIVLD
jgi:hypothetical protein